MLGESAINAAIGEEMADAKAVSQAKPKRRRRMQIAAVRRGCRILLNRHGARDMNSCVKLSLRRAKRESRAEAMSAPIRLPGAKMPP